VMWCAYVQDKCVSIVSLAVEMSLSFALPLMRTSRVDTRSR
jgi:hypothetical protein